MTSVREVLPLLILAAVGLVVLLYWIRRNGHDDVNTDDFLQVQEAVNSLVGELSLAARLFEPDDMQFVSRQPSQEARRLLLEDRKVLALSWLRQLRRHLRRLKELHLRLASYTNNPSPRVDLGFLTDYVIFAAACDILIVFVWIRGPFEARVIARHTLSSAKEIYALFNRRVENINAELLSPAHVQRTSLNG